MIIFIKYLIIEMDKLNQLGFLIVAFHRFSKNSGNLLISQNQHPWDFKSPQVIFHCCFGQNVANNHFYQHINICLP